MINLGSLKGYNASELVHYMNQS